MLRNKATLMVLAGLSGLAGSLCQAQTIAATEDAGAITVAIPGVFKVLVNRSRGFGARMYDLKNSPDYNLSSAYSGNGLFWVSTSPVEMPKSLGRQYYANPIETLELLEPGPTRVRMKLVGSHHEWGQQGKLPGVRFTETFAMYASGAVYGEYRLAVEETPVSLHYLAMGLVTTGYWGKHGLNQVRVAGEFGAKPFAGPTASSFLVQWSDGPDYFADILLAMYKGKYNSGNLWEFDEGRLLEYATIIQCTSLLPQNPIPAGSQTVVNFLIRFGDDMNAPEPAARYANDYRSPDRLAVRVGRAVNSDDGDHDADGFNEREGCYVITSDAQGVDFSLHGRAIPRMSPAFKLREWRGAAPKAILVDGVALAEGKGFGASVRDGVLIVQILRNIETDAAIVIRNDIAPPAGPAAPDTGKTITAVPPVKPVAPEPATEKPDGSVVLSDAVEKMMFDVVEKLAAAKPPPGAPSAYCRGARAEIVKDPQFADGKTALRIDIRSDTWQLGMKGIDPRRSVWDGYDYFTFDVYNPGKDMNDLVWMIGGPGVKTRDGAWYKEMLLRPGRNRVEIELSGAPVDWTQALSQWELSQFQMSTSDGATLCLTNFRLVKGDPRALRRKGANIIHIDSSKRFQMLP